MIYLRRQKNNAEPSARAPLPVAPTRTQIDAAYPLICASLNCDPEHAKVLVAEIYQAFIDTAPPPIMYGLIRRQAEVMIALQDYADAHGYMPTLRELADLVEVKNHGDVSKIIDALERKGFLIRGSGNREIDIIKRLN